MDASSSSASSSTGGVDSASDPALPSDPAHPSFTPSSSPALDIRKSEGRISDPCPESHRMPSLRDPPGPDLQAPSHHHSHPSKSLAAFRQAEGPAIRAAKLRNLWASLPSQLPASSSSPTPTELAKLPGQGTLQALSPERAERLRRLYEEELVKRCEEERPEARLWGGSDDLEPYGLGGTGQTPGQTIPAGKKGIAWKDFRRFLWDQERELWDIFHDLDRNGDGMLDAGEMRRAFQRSGIDLTPSTVRDLVGFLSTGSRGPSSAEDTYITFAEFRDFLIMLPRRPSVAEIYKFYQVKKRFGDGRGAARLNMEGDLNVSFPKSSNDKASSSDWFTTSPPSSSSSSSSPPDTSPTPASHLSPEGCTGGDVDGSSTADVDHSSQGAGGGELADGMDCEFDEDEDFGDVVDGEDQEEDGIGWGVAWKFLLAGGIAGAVSRTATAPFDRLKIYLITAVSPTTAPAVSATELKHPLRLGFAGAAHLKDAVLTIFKEGGGLRAFWVGNGLNVTKIFPESAIKFFSYEYSKRFFAKYWDCVEDQSQISGTSRFIAGGIGGITSQLSIYPVETLKTQLQSTRGPAQGKKVLMETAKRMWLQGGMRAYYRGLTLGLIGVFPYSAIDMSTFEALKLAYCRSTGKDEPETVAVLTFGAASGSIGATTVYPINLLRTRLQASGSSGHPQTYTGFWDVTTQTLQKEGWRGLYRGLGPTLAKVVPAVSISYVVYEHAKRELEIS